MNLLFLCNIWGGGGNQLANKENILLFVMCMKDKVLEAADSHLTNMRGALAYEWN